MIAPARPVSAVDALSRSRGLVAAFVLTAILLVVASAIRFQAPQTIGAEKVLTDFDAFYIAGQMAGRGHVADAYDASTFLRAQREASGTQRFMPWTYPPPFTLFVQGLTGLPIGLAYGLFTLTTFAFYVCTLYRITGERLAGVLIAIFPVVLINLRTGQNGFLTAGLLGTFLLALRDRRSAAGGLPLGLMVIKPHLAVAAGLLAALRRSAALLAIAGAFGIAAAGLSTAVYGFGVWSNFIGAVGEASHFLALGYYPLFRMVSPYAALFSYGVDAPLALGAQAISAALALGLLLYAHRRALAFCPLAALTCAATLFVSPYCYDYDLAILGLALAFLADDLVARTRPWALAGLLALSWMACGYGLGVQIVIEKVLHENAGGVMLESQRIWPAFTAPLLLALCLATWAVLKRGAWPDDQGRASADPARADGGGLSANNR